MTVDEDRMKKNPITVFGSGSWGTALAILLARNGHTVLMWGNESSEVDAIASTGRNERYLPGIDLPANMAVTSDLSEAIKNRDWLIAVPSHAFRHVLETAFSGVDYPIRVSWASKGFDPMTSRILSETAQRILPHDIPIAVISGPSFAREVALGLPTAVTVASNNDELAYYWVSSLANHCFRVYTSDDMIGVQIGGAIKNVMAIAAGMSDGLGFGANAKCALISRGIVEMTRLAVALGAKSETMMGLAGLGDLVLTCTDDQSRNRRFGLALGQGQSAEQAIQSIGQVIEGASAVEQAVGLAEEMGIDMPITHSIHQILHDKLTAHDAVTSLFSRPYKAEMCKI